MAAKPGYIILFLNSIADAKCAGNRGQTGSVQKSAAGNGLRQR